MFQKYNSIENSYREEFINKIKIHGYWDKTYVVQEKAHGANLSFWNSDGINFQAAKRTADLGVQEEFHNHQLILESHLERLQALYTNVIQEVGPAKVLTIYGELIGGSYPHEDVLPVKGASKVQKGVFYSPMNEFYAFDIRINMGKYLNPEIARSLFEKHQILHAKILHEGNLESCLAFPNEFQSTIPELLGLPPIESNFCEGVIIRSLQELHFNNGVRVILKNKNENWSEKAKKAKSPKQKEDYQKKSSACKRNC